MLPLKKIIKRNGKNYQILPLSIIFNEIKINKILISQHHYENRPEINGEIIYNLVLQLNNRKDIESEPKKENEEDKFSYFVFEEILIGIKAYKLVIWLEDNQNYIGVRTCFRNRKYDAMLNY